MVPADRENARVRHHAFLKAKTCPHFVKDPKCGCVTKGTCKLGVVPPHIQCTLNPHCIDCVLVGGWEKVERDRAALDVGTTLT